MEKTLYIYSFRPEVEYENLDYDWFVGEDTDDYDHSEMIVANYMVENGYGEDYDEALEKLESVYKQDRKVLLKQLGE